MLIAGAATLVLIFAGQAIQASSELANADTDAEQLIARPDSFGTVLLGSIVSGLGFAALSVPLFALFRAAANRSPQVRTALGPLVILGPILVGLTGILQVVALDQIAATFVEGSPTTGDEAETRAEELIQDDSLYTVGSSLGLAGLFGLTIGMFYTALSAMRTGLVTRFFATLGMALSVLVLLSQFFGSIGILGTIVWVVIVALQYSGRSPRGRPPAWEEGRAIPWPKPGEEPVAAPTEEETARPEDFDGTATEVDDDELGERPGRRDNKRKRKRKQRG